jgi:hypothetical protein
MKRDTIFKCRISYDENGDIHVISYSNKQIPFELLDRLNDAVHDVCDKHNGRLVWKNTYIKFINNGIKYKQIDNEEILYNPCRGCVFHKDYDCKHPFFAYKGNCEGKHYVIDEG